MIGSHLVKTSIRTAALTLALALAAAPALAHHCKGGHFDPETCDVGGGGGGGDTSELLYKVDFTSHLTFVAPTYLPLCSAQTQNERNYTALFDRHDLCATVFTSSGVALTDDILIQVGKNKDKHIVSVQLFGQDVIGKDGIAHESEIVEIDPPVVPSESGFIVEVDIDDLPIWKMNKHLTGGGKRIEIIGYISIGDMVYSPLPQ